jgi:hypothetical protein
VSVAKTKPIAVEPPPAHYYYYYYYNACMFVSYINSTKEHSSNGIQEGIDIPCSVLNDTTCRSINVLMQRFELVLLVLVKRHAMAQDIDSTSIESIGI